MKKQTQPMYKLRQLIINKYGEQKFAIGVELVARWISFETGKKTTMETVLSWCNATPKSNNKPVTPKQFLALSRLFALNNKEENFFNTQKHFK